MTSSITCHPGSQYRRYFLLPHTSLGLLLPLQPFCVSASDPGSFPFLSTAESSFHYFITWCWTLQNTGRQLSTIVCLLIYRVGQQLLFYAVWYATYNEFPSDQNPSRKAEWGGLGKLGLLKAQKNKGITAALIAQFFPLGFEQKAVCKTEVQEKLKKQLYLSRENRGKFCVKSVAQSKPEKNKQKKTE